MRILPGILLGSAALLATPITALAHHSFAMFDNTRSVTLHGTVTRFQWTNPHGYLEIDADDGQGGIKHFTLEMTSPNMMSRGGWTLRTIKRSKSRSSSSFRARIKSS